MSFLYCNYLSPNIDKLFVVVVVVVVAASYGLDDFVTTGCAADVPGVDFRIVGFSVAVPGTLLRDTVVVADMAAAYLGYSEHTLD